MATTLTLQNSINFVAPILKNQPLMVSGFEPALSAANMVLQTILGPPFKWRFNRNTFSFAITGAATDYVEALADFGFLETQWLKDASGSILPLQGAIALPIDSNPARPTKIAIEFDDNAGNLTFRMDRKPDAAYTVYGDYQKKAALLTSAASVWGTVPDEFSYIFNEGFLCRMCLLVNDSRFPVFENYFVAHLLGAQDGLTDQERNIFLANWANVSQTLQRAMGAVNAGVAGRGK